MSEPVGVLIVAAGAGLLYAAVTDQNPVTELRKALSTGAIDGRPPASAPFGSSILDFVRGVGAQVGAGVGTSPPAAAPAAGAPLSLTPIGQGGHRLDAQAATAFATWARLFGRAIPITDSFRSAQQQADAHRRDPNRFASPGNSAHELGLAVDVNLGAIGARPQGGTPSAWLRDATYSRLVAAARQAGWRNYQLESNSTGGKIAEPWHFSYGVLK